MRLDGRVLYLYLVSLSALSQRSRRVVEGVSLIEYISIPNAYVVQYVEPSELIFVVIYKKERYFNESVLGNVHLLPEGGGSKSGGSTKLLKVGRGVYEKNCTS